MTASTTQQGLFDCLCDVQNDRLALQQAAQLALQVEFTTIPAYLQAMYSISDVESKAYQTLRSVVIEEMFHLNQAANLVVALGGLPKMTGNVVPAYPCYLPQANPITTPLVGLYRASPEVFESVFVAIEEPAPPHAPPQGDQYSTIAQLYDALLLGMENYSGSEPLFADNPEGRQRTDIYVGKFGGTPIEVVNMATARFGITEILQQGEGSVPEGQALVASEPFATYNQYGKRSDGTYGPIIGTPHELSHFIKFRQIALDTVNFPPTYPVISNPLRDDFKSARATQLAVAFDCCYSMMLDALQNSFRKTPNDDKADPFFAVVLPLMHQYLPTLARMLMTTPMREDGDGSIGPNAAPTWVYMPNVTLEHLRQVVTPMLGNPQFGRSDCETLNHMLAHITQLTAVHA